MWVSPINARKGKQLMKYFPPFTMDVFSVRRKLFSRMKMKPGRHMVPVVVDCIFPGIFLINGYLSSSAEITLNI